MVIIANFQMVKLHYLFVLVLLVMHTFVDFLYVFAFIRELMHYFSGYTHFLE